MSNSATFISPLRRFFLYVNALPDIPYPAMLSDAKRILEDLPHYKFVYLLGRSMPSDEADDIKNSLDQCLTVMISASRCDTPLEDYLAHHPLAKDAWRN